MSPPPTSNQRPPRAARSGAELATEKKRARREEKMLPVSPSIACAWLHAVCVPLQRVTLQRDNRTRLERATDALL